MEGLPEVMMFKLGPEELVGINQANPTWTD